MNATRLLIAAALSVAALGAQADEADGSQNVIQFNGTATRAQVQAQLANKGANTFSIQYNPLTTFQGQRTREEVRAEFLGSRDAVAAMTAEDSGSAYLAARHDATTARDTQLAGQPRNPQ